jgi:hypothetical protein
MFRQLYESFTDPQQELNQNIARYQSVEPNLVVFNSQNGYSFPNAGITTQQQQGSNANLQASLNSLGNVPNYSAPNSVATGITNIGAVLTGIDDDIGQNLQSCRQYTGLQGLSNMSRNPGESQGCAWRYKPGAGVVAEVAQGAYGTPSGPLDPAVPKKDPVGNGIKYYWNLQDAEKDMVKDICKSATHCQDMSVLPGSLAGDFKNVCAYCKTSKKIIPVKNVNGQIIPRYTDLDLQCSRDNLITADNTGRCPPPEPGAQQPQYWKCLNPGKLDRDCVTMASYFAGCGPQGTLASALSQGDSQADYANKLRQKKSFQVYQQLANPVLSEDVIKTGNATLFASFLNIYNVNTSQYNQTNEKLRVAAQDLCTNAGLFDTYNFCDDLTDSSREFDTTCMQKEFMKQGGTPQGTKYPKAKTDAAGMTWGQYKQSIMAIVNDTRATDPEKQRTALNQLSGLGLQMVPTDLARAAENQGIEIFWFDYRNQTLMGRRATLSSSGSNLPFFNVGGGVVGDTGLIDQVGFIAFADLRPADSKTIRFGVVTDDGYGVAINQDFFVPTDNSKRFSWWYPQGPTWHMTPNIPLAADSSKMPNIMTVAWYESGGGAMSQSYFMIPGQVNGWTAIGDTAAGLNSTWKDLCYFTQELNAPAVSFEVYNRRNQTVFCEKRMWSHYLSSTPVPGVTHSKILQAPEMPTGKHQVVLVNKTWKTNTKIAYSAFNTMTFCFTVDSVSSTQTMLAWGDITIQVSKLTDTASTVTLRFSNGTTSIPYQIKNGQWCMATLTWTRMSNFDKNIKACNFFVQTVANLKAGTIMNAVAQYTYTPGGVLFFEYKANRAGTATITLGSNNLSCRVAWLHFFDREWRTSDVDLFKIEVSGSWKGRWFE